MKFEHYQKKLLESEAYKQFKKENPKSYLCAGFFVLDFETGKHMHQLDYIFKDKKIATFSLDEGVKMNISSMPLKKKLPEIKEIVQTDLEALKGIVEDEMKNRTITDNIKKIIAVLQIVDGKTTWNLNCITDNLNVLQVHIDDADRTILKFMKYSIMELVKTMPGGMAMPKNIKVNAAAAAAGKAAIPKPEPQAAPAEEAAEEE